MKRAMLVCTRSFSFNDHYRGRCQATAGVTQVREGSDLALAYPGHFKPASERDTQIRSGDSYGVNFGRTAVRVTGDSAAPAPVKPQRQSVRYDQHRQRWVQPARKTVAKQPAARGSLDRVDRDRRQMRQQRQFEKAKVSDGFGPTVVTISRDRYQDDVCRFIENAMRSSTSEIGFQLFGTPQSRPELHVSRVGRPAPNAIRTSSSFQRDPGWDTGQLAKAREQCPGICEAGFLHTHSDDSGLSDSDISHLVSCRELFNLARYVFVIATADAVRGWRRPQLTAWTAREERLHDTFPTGRVLVERSRVLIS
jgi:hypothetical protein